MRLPTDGSPDFWDPERDGGFDEADVRRGFPDYRELGVKPLPYEEWREPDPESWDDDSSPHGYAADAIAYYLPWHLGGNDYWGIYFRVPHLKRYIEWVERKLGQGNLAPLLVEQVFWHEMEHYEQELAATVLENVTDRILYPQWLDERHKIPVGLLNENTGRWEEVNSVEEALAVAREVEWAKRHERKWGWPTHYTKFVEWNSKRLPTGYNRFYLCLGKDSRQMARTAFLESVRSVAGLSLPGYPDQETANRLFSTPTERYDAVPVYHVYH